MIFFFFTFLYNSIIEILEIIQGGLVCNGALQKNSQPKLRYSGGDGIRDHNV